MCNVMDSSSKFGLDEILSFRMKDFRVKRISLLGLMEPGDKTLRIFARMCFLQTLNSVLSGVELVFLITNRNSCRKIYTM